MNCTHLQARVEDAVDDGVGPVLVVVVLYAGALLLVCCGARLVRAAAFFLGAASGAWGTYRVAASLDCEVRLVSAAAVGLLVGGALACVVRLGLSLVTAAGAGTIAHFVYDAVVGARADNASFRLLGQPGYHVVVVGAAGVVGVVGACVFDRTVLVVGSSVLGGACAALATHLLVRELDGTLPRLATLTTGAAVAVVGVAVQWRRRPARRQRDPADDA